MNPYTARAAVVPYYPAVLAVPYLYLLVLGKQPSPGSKTPWLLVARCYQSVETLALAVMKCITGYSLAFVHGVLA